MNRNWIYIPIIVLILALAWYFHTIIVYILIAAVLSLIGEPFVRFLSYVTIKNRHLPRAAAAALTMSALFVFFGILIRSFIPMVVNEARKLSNLDMEHAFSNLQGPLLSFQNLINQLRITETPIVLETELRHLFLDLFDLSAVGNSVHYAVGVTGDVLIAFFAITFITFFFLKDQYLLKRMIMAVVPNGYEERADKVLHASKELLTRYFIGVIIEMAIIMTVVSLGLTIVGIDNAILLGFVAGLFNIIPYVGPIIGAIVGISVALVSNSTGMDLTDLLGLTGQMVIVYGAAQLLDNIVLQPLIYSQSVKAHPLEIFLVILMAGNVGGIAGMIVAVPVYSIARVFVGEFFNQFKVVKALTGRNERDPIL